MRNTRFKLLLCALALGVSTYSSTTLAAIVPHSSGGVGAFDPGVIDQRNVIQMQQYEENKRKRLGDEQPHRVKYRKLTE